MTLIRPNDLAERLRVAGYVDEADRLASALQRDAVWNPSGQPRPNVLALSMFGSERWDEITSALEKAA